jgi:hypothetical protein
MRLLAITNVILEIVHCAYLEVVKSLLKELKIKYMSVKIKLYKSFIKFKLIFFNETLLEDLKSFYFAR